MAGATDSYAAQAASQDRPGGRRARHLLRHLAIAVRRPGAVERLGGQPDGRDDGGGSTRSRSRGRPITVHHGAPCGWPRKWVTSVTDIARHSASPDARQAGSTPCSGSTERTSSCPSASSVAGLDGLLGCDDDARLRGNYGFDHIDGVTPPIRPSMRGRRRSSATVPNAGTGPARARQTPSGRQDDHRPPRRLGPPAGQSTRCAPWRRQRCGSRTTPRPGGGTGPAAGRQGNKPATMPSTVPVLRVLEACPGQRTCGPLPLPLPLRPISGKPINLDRHSVHLLTAYVPGV